MQWLKELRESKNKTQTDISESCGISQVAYSYIENDLRRPSVAVAKKIGAVLGFDWTRFYEIDTDEVQENESVEGSEEK